jgi:hypothetical protein
MRSSLRPTVVTLALLSACASSPPTTPAPAPSPAPASAPGGTLRCADMPTRNPFKQQDTIEIWGSSEAPANARLQAALALVDAVTRAELAKFIETSLQASDLDQQSERGQAIESHTLEVARARIGQAAPLEHGYATVAQDGQATLKLCAKLVLRREALMQTLQQSLPDRPTAELERVVGRLFLP